MEPTEATKRERKHIHRRKRNAAIKDNVKKRRIILQNKNAQSQAKEDSTNKRGEARIIIKG